MDFEISYETCVQFYLMSAWLYECKKESVLPDEVYDSLCRFIYDNWDIIEHRHKHLIDKDSLLVTASQLPFDEFPRIITDSALYWLSSSN